MKPYITTDDAVEILSRMMHFEMILEMFMENGTMISEKILAEETPLFLCLKKLKQPAYSRKSLSV